MCSVADLPFRIQEKISVDEKTGCWIWKGSIHPCGYGRVNIKGKIEKAHRAVLSYAGIALKPNLVVDHLCRVRRCVNPSHLEQVTNLENIQRGKALRTTCSKGHPLSGENLRITKFGKYNFRVCRICNSLFAKQWREKKKELKKGGYELGSL